MWVESWSKKLVNLAFAAKVDIVGPCRRGDPASSAAFTVEAELATGDTPRTILFLGTADQCRAYLANLRNELAEVGELKPIPSS